MKLQQNVLKMLTEHLIVFQKTFDKVLRMN